MRDSRERPGPHCVQVYGAEISDLLKGGESVGQSKVAAQHYVLDGSASIPITTEREALNRLAEADSQKRRAATAMNERSSRAHSVVMLALSQRHRSSDQKVESLLFLADLGGSEQVKKSKVSGSQMQEAIYINQGLFALGKCVDAHNDGLAYIPYQGSKLTQLLSGALGGDSKTTVVICAGAEDAHAMETLQAMRFGERCMKVENEAAVGLSAMTAAVEALNGEIEQCEEFIRVNERWETKVVETTDERAGLHTASDEQLEEGRALQEKLGQHSSIIVRQEVAALRHWIEVVEGQTEAAEPDPSASENAVLAVKEAAARLRSAGHLDLGDALQTLVVVRVQATADVAVMKKHVTLLVGAEEHRARLEELLNRRRLLTGA